jgi:hypothetical protein
MVNYMTRLKGNIIYLEMLLQVESDGPEDEVEKRCKEQYNADDSE